MQWRRQRTPFFLPVESRAPITIPVFVMPAVIDIKVGGLVAAATYSVFPINFTNRHSHFEKVDLHINKSPPSIWLKTGMIDFQKVNLKKIFTHFELSSHLIGNKTLRICLLEKLGMFSVLAFLC